MKKIFLLLACSVILGPTVISCEEEGDIICMDTVYYKDKDGDGRGDRTQYLYSCEVQPKGFVSNSDDKDDNNPNG